MKPDEQKNYGFSEYLSPFTWRYGSKDMREIFSEVKYRVLWREIWVSLAEAQSKFNFKTFFMYERIFLSGLHLTA